MVKLINKLILLKNKLTAIIKLQILITFFLYLIWIIIALLQIKRMSSHYNFHII